VDLEAVEEVFLTAKEREGICKAGKDKSLILRPLQTSSKDFPLQSGPCAKIAHRAIS